MKLFKILFSIVFLLISILWILYTLFFFGLYQDGWEWVLKIPGMRSLHEWITKLVSDAQNGGKYLGLQMVLIGGAILLGYTAIYFPLKHIPFIGQLIKFLTCIVPVVSGITLILGFVLLFTDLQNYLPNGGNFVDYALNSIIA